MASAPRTPNPVRELAQRLVRERAELEAKLAAIRPLQKRMREINAALRMLERLDGDAATAAHDAMSGTTGESLGARLERLLRAAGRPMPAAELFRALIVDGWTAPRAGRALIRQTLMRDRERFVRSGNVFALRETADSPLRAVSGRQRRTA